MLNQHFKFGDIKPTTYFFSVGLFLAIVLSTVANDNEALHPLVVFCQWLAQVFIPLSFLIYLHVALQKIQSFDVLNPWLKLLITGLISSVLFSPIAFCIDVFLGSNTQPSDLHGWISSIVEELSHLIVPITVSWIAMNAPWVLGLSLKRDTPLTHVEVQQATVNTTSDNESEQESKRLFEVPIEEILYLKAEHHYLRIVSLNQSKLILYNLKDAISQIPPDFCIQTHRSYWVAFKHITKIENSQQNKLIRMFNEDLVPISRRNVSSVKLALKNKLN